MNKIKRKILGWFADGVKEITPTYHDDKMIRDLQMIESYLHNFIANSKCKIGQHTWDAWNCRVTDNVQGLSKDTFSMRCCLNCGIEMPESRKGEKNYLVFPDIACPVCGSFHPKTLMEKSIQKFKKNISKR